MMEKWKGKYETNVFSDTNLDITPGGFSPTVTSTADPIRTREQLIQQYLYQQRISNPVLELQVPNIEQANATSQENMDIFLDQFLAENLKTNVTEKPLSDMTVEDSEGELSKLTLIDIDTINDKLIDIDELPQEFLQPAANGNHNYESPFDTNMTEIGWQHNSVTSLPHIGNTLNTEWQHGELTDGLPLSISTAIPQDGTSVQDFMGSFNSDEFHAIDDVQLDQDENDCIKRSDLSVEESFAKKVNLDHLSFSGYQEQIDVTPKPSWIISPLKKYLKPGNKIDVDDLLKARSCKLGALGDVFEEKPSFGMGMGCLSPPVKDHPTVEYPNEENEECNLLTALDTDDDVSDVELTTMQFVSQLPEEEKPTATSSSHDEIDSLEETLHNFRGQLTSEDMKKLCIMASKSNKPGAILEKILEIARQQVNNTCNASEIETSVDILEIRKQNEALRTERANIWQRNEAKTGRMLQGDGNLQMKTSKPMNMPDVQFEPAQKDSSDLILNKIPTEVSPAEQCIVGIGAKVHVELLNPFSTIMHIKLKRISETLNGHTLSSPVLSFKADYYIQPLSRSTITFHLCSRAAGTFCGLLEMSVEKNSGSSYNSRVLKVSATVEVPSIDVICDDAIGLIDFGILPESCCEKKRLHIINKSKIMFPITMSVEKCFWGDDKSPNFHSISANVLSCELPADETVIFNTIQYRAPRLPDCNPVQVTDTLRIMLDRPLFTPLIIKEVPIKTIIGKVSLRTTKSVSPLEITGVAGELTVTEVPLLNGSDFPLTARLSCSSDLFTTSVPVIVIESKKECTAKIFFRPTLQTQQMVHCKLDIILEPDGMHLEIPLVGVSEQPRQKNAVSIVHPIKIQKDIALQCNKTSFVFGCISMGNSSAQKLKLINSWTDDCLDLSICVLGSSAFNIFLEGSSIPADFITIGASDKLILNVVFSPEDCQPHSGTIVIKPRGIKEKMKFQLPVQGFGGRGELVLNEWKHGGNIDFGHVVPEQPVNATTTAVNRGDRSIFVKMCIESEYSEVKANVSIHPETFQLRPMESRNLTLIASLVSADCSGHRSLGSLSVIWGDDILMRRFQRLKNRNIDQRKVPDVDPSIVKADWATVYLNDETNEKDNFSSRPEDVAVFLRCCTKLSMKMEANIENCQSLSNSSSTLHPVLFQEETMTSMLYAADRKKTSQPPVPEREFHIGCETFKVSPPVVNLSVDNLEAKVYLVSFVDEELFIEVKSEASWLHINPQEATVSNYGFTPLLVRITPDKPPYISGSQTSFQVFSENFVQTVKVHVSISGSNRQPVTQDQLSNPQKAMPPPSSNERLRSNLNKQKVPTLKCAVDVPRRLALPDAKVQSESIQKLVLKNISAYSQQIKTDIASDSFFVKHKEFIMKPHTSVAVPVFFRPKCRKQHKSILHITIVSENLILPVQLYGLAA